MLKQADYYNISRDELRKYSADTAQHLLVYLKKHLVAYVEVYYKTGFAN